MINKAIALYTIIDDLLKAIGHEQDPRAKMSDAEVITTMLIAAMEFAGNFQKGMDFMKESGLIPNMLSKSRFCRRAHALEELVNDLFLQIGMLLKEANIHMQYIIDSFPVPICDNIRISRCRIVTGEEFRGYIPSKRRYFYGVRIHMITTADGIPVEFVFLPGLGMISTHFIFCPCSCLLEASFSVIRPTTIMRLRMPCGWWIRLSSLL